MPALNAQRKGETFALGLTLIEAWFPIFAYFSANALGGLHAYFYSLIVAIIALIIIWLAKRRQHELFNRRAYLPLAMTSLFITTLFSLIFIGLQYTSANNVAILLFLQVLFSYLYFHKKEGEQLSAIQGLGAVLMTIGALLVLFPQEFQLRIGDGLIVLAAMLAPIANVWQKKARTEVSSETILLVRSLMALPFLYILAQWLEPDITTDALQQQAHWIILTGVLVFVIAKLLWIEAIYLLPITKVSAIFAFAPLMTIALSYWLLDDTSTWQQILGALPILLGSYFITRKPNAA